MSGGSRACKKKPRDSAPRACSAPEGIRCPGSGRMMTGRAPVSPAAARPGRSARLARVRREEEPEPGSLQGGRRGGRPFGDAFRPIRRRTRRRRTAARPGVPGGPRPNGPDGRAARSPPPWQGEGRTERQPASGGPVPLAAVAGPPGGPRPHVGGKGRPRPCRNDPRPVTCCVPRIPGPRMRGDRRPRCRSGRNQCAGHTGPEVPGSSAKRHRQGAGS